MDFSNEEYETLWLFKRIHTKETVDMMPFFREEHPLRHTILYSLPAVMKWLISIGVNVNVKDDYNYTPLTYAVLNQEYGCAELLLRAGANPNVLIGCSETSLIRNSIVHNDIPWCKLLLLHGAKINNEGTTTDLDWADIYNRVDIAKLLVDYGAKYSMIRNTNPQIAAFISQRNACREASQAILRLQKQHSSALGKCNGRDVLKIVAKCVWSHRFNFEQ